MKASTILVVTGSALVLIASGQALGAYASIQHNLIDGVGDTHYTAADGRLSVSANSNNLTLNDPSPLSGSITNGHVELETWLHSYEPSTGKAVFTGGTYDLTFTFDGVARELSGSFYGLEVVYHYVTPTYSYFDGEASWQADTINLPGSGVWPAGTTSPSSMTSLTLAFGTGLAGFDWSIDFAESLRAETTYTLWPDDRAVPEPASLILLALGSLGLIRRRHA